MSESNYVENPKQRRQWTEEEDEICRKYYPSEGSSINKRLHGRTRQACRLRARFLGISSNKEVRYMRSNSWTPEEIEILKKYYPEEGARVVKRLPNRTATNCTSKASELKIRSTGAKKEYARWTKEDNEILRKYYPIEGEACFTRFPYRTYRACQAHARKIGLAKPHMLPWTEEEERILRENYPVMRTQITELLPHRSKAACTLRASQKKISSRNKSKREYSDEDE